MATPPPSATSTRAATNNSTAAPAAYMPSVPLSTSLVGTLLLDRFRVVEPLGEGGMAMVFRAEHITIGKQFAIKVLLPEHAGKPDLVRRFLQEARAASMIRHENVVEITDYGKAPNGCVFMVMELLEGEDLASTILGDGRMPWPRARAILLQICRALAVAHDKGIVHRDIKPDNVFLIHRHGSSDFVKVLDFGIAKILEEVGGGRSLTKTGSIFGTPGYMAPEQAESMKVDHRADIYSLGVLMYELITGEVPFMADTFVALMAKHLYDPPPAPSQMAPNAGISPEVEALILKAMQKDREFRFQTVDELARAIEAVGTGAGPVEVIPEHRTQPQTRGVETSYSDSFPTIAVSADTLVFEPPTPPPAPSRKRAVIVAAGALAIGALIAALAGPWKERSPPPPAVTLVTPEDPPSQPEDPPPSPTVSVVLTTNVDAEVIDADSKTVLGRTNEAGFSLPRTQAPLQVLLHAEGYQDLPLDLVAGSDIAQSHTLTKTAPVKKKKKKRKKKKKKKKKEDDPLSLLPMGD